jgi:hypothetical protein
MANPYKRLLALIPGQRIETGQVIATYGDGCLIELPTGAQLKVRGTAEVGDFVFVRDGAIEGPAPDLDGLEIEI